MITNSALETLSAPAEQTGTRATLRLRIGAEIEALSAQIANADAGSPLASGSRAGRIALAGVHGRIRELGQLLAGLADPRDLRLDPHAAGFGSTIELRDAIRGDRTTVALMTGTTIDVVENQVSMDSPIGAALTGARPGDVIEVETPAGERRLEVLNVTTLLQRFDG